MPEKKKEIISELQFIKGVGPVKAQALAKEGIFTHKDLVEYFPRDYINRNVIDSLKALSIKLRQDLFSNLDDINKNFLPKNEVIIIAQIANKTEKRLKNNRKMLIFALTDGTGGSAQIIFWSFTDYYNKTYSVGDTLTICGKAELNQNGNVSFHHPEIIKFDPEDEQIYLQGGILPIYPFSQSLRNAHWTMHQLRAIIDVALAAIGNDIKETLPEYLLKKFSYPERRIAVNNLHFPESFESIEVAKNRMKFEEIFFFELFLAIRKAGIKINETAVPIASKSPTARMIFESLPFQLTSDQKKVIRELADDLSNNKPMNRLLQGDVGSGKTIVALLTMVMAIDNGFQVVILAPTEILAEQHFHTFSKYLDGFKIEIAMLVGGQKVKQRREILENIESGKTKIIIGTHALFESEVKYYKLGLIVIDEQHRFGVAQRAKLKSLGKSSFEESQYSPHVLVMSATPIPRTLSLTLYGDLDVSVIREMPKNRKPITTRVSFESKLNEEYNFIRQELKKGFQTYIVFPLVEKSEKLELKAATEYFEQLQTEIFPEFKCALLHGQMFWYEKEEIMKAFLNKEYNVLIATTVIEVGIDVPNATIMLINNAERFGLSTLHQLRGRVGRSEYQSYCILATKDNYQYEFKRKDTPDEERKAAIIRLKTMTETGDGFKIAEVDLKLRGYGDMLGTRQSGLPAFKFIDLITDGDLITLAKKVAFKIIEEDPHLRKPENQILRNEFIEKFSEGKNYFDIA